MYRKDSKINLNSNPYFMSLYLVSGHDPYVGSFTISRPLSQNINIISLVCSENKEKYFTSEHLMTGYLRSAGLSLISTIS